MSAGSGRPSRTPFATYDPGSLCWRTSAVTLDGDYPQWSGTWPAWGMTRSGAAYALTKSAALTDGSGSSSPPLLPTPDATHGRTSTRTGPLLPGVVQMLPTPAARLGGRGMPSPETAERRQTEEGRRNLEDALALLPTPRATDGTKGGPNQRGTSGDLMLPSAVALLPTPTATPYGNNQSPSSGASVRPSLDSMASTGALTPPRSDGGSTSLDDPHPPPPSPEHAGRLF